MRSKNLTLSPNGNDKKLKEKMRQVEEQLQRQESQAIDQVRDKLKEKMLLRKEEFGRKSTASQLL
jgi:hypothetical protein